MKNIKNVIKMSLLMMLFPVFESIYSAQDAEQDTLEFMQESNDQYLYSKIESSVPADGAQIEPSVDVKVVNNVFDSGLTRTKITVNLLGDQIVTTKETWLTAHPSYFTSKNKAMALGLSAVTLGLLGYLYKDELIDLVMQYTDPVYKNVKQRKFIFNQLDTYLVDKIKQLTAIMNNNETPEELLARKQINFEKMFEEVAESLRAQGLSPEEIEATLESYKRKLFAKESFYMPNIKRLNLLRNSIKYLEEHYDSLD